MSGKAQPVNLRILEKEYVVACPEDEREYLRESADYLNKKVQEIRETGKVVGTERMIVMAALNIVHDLLQYKRQETGYTNHIGDEVRRLEEKIDLALAGDR